MRVSKPPLLRMSALLPLTGATTVHVPARFVSVTTSFKWTPLFREGLATKGIKAIFPVDLGRGDEHCGEDRVVCPAGNKSRALLMRAPSLASGGMGKPKSLDGSSDSKAGEPDNVAARNSLTLVDSPNMLHFIFAFLSSDFQ